LINILLLIGSSRRMTLLRTEGETSIFLDSDDSERAWRRVIKVWMSNSGRYSKLVLMLFFELFFLGTLGPYLALWLEKIKFYLM